MLHVQEIQARIEQRLGSYNQLLQKIVNNYNAMDEDREYVRRAAASSPEGRWVSRLWVDDVDFDTDWELRVHRNMTEQLRAELVTEIEALQKFVAGLERRASKAGYEATNALPRPQSEPSAQQSNKVRIEAAKRLAGLRRGTTS